MLPAVGSASLWTHKAMLHMSADFENEVHLHGSTLMEKLQIISLFNRLEKHDFKISS